MQLDRLIYCILKRLIIMAEMNTLIIGVETKGAKEAATELDHLAKSGEKAEKTTKGVGKGAGQTVAPFQVYARRYPASLFPVAGYCGTGAVRNRRFHYSWSAGAATCLYLWPRRRCFRCCSLRLVL